jgi:hypothetical protein
MGWFEYSCCGQTFTRKTRHERTPMTCPLCGSKVSPIVSLHVKHQETEEARRLT